MGEDGRGARPAARGFVLNADDPLIADLGRDAEERRARGRRLLRDRGPLARRCRSCSTPSTPSTAAAAATPTPTSAPSSATSATTPAPTAAPSGRGPTSRRRGSSCAGWTGSRGRRSAPPRARSSSSCRSPASTTSTTRSPRSPPALRLGVAPERIAAALGRDAGRLRPGRDDRGRRHAGLDPADQEPGRRQRGAAHAAAGGRRGRRDRPLDRPQRPDRRRPRRLLDLGRRLRAARRAPCAASSAPAPGRRRWRCG